MATQFTSVGIKNYAKIGSGFIAGLLAASGISLYLGGNIATDRSLNPTPKQLLGTGAYMTYVESDPCTNTGSRQTYTHCRVTNPFTGTGVIRAVQYDSNKAPNASKIICETTPTATSTSTGTVIRNINYSTSGSGQSLVSSTGSVILPPNASVRCWAASAPGVSVKAKLRVWLVEQYVP